MVIIGSKKLLRIIRQPLREALRITREFGYSDQTNLGQYTGIETSTLASKETVKLKFQ